MRSRLTPATLTPPGPASQILRRRAPRRREIPHVRGYGCRVARRPTTSPHVRGQCREQRPVHPSTWLRGGVTLGPGAAVRPDRPTPRLGPPRRTHAFRVPRRQPLVQDRYDSRALADRIDSLLVSDTISEGDRAFIEDRDMFFLATADAEGRPTCSYKGGEPGFVRVLDAHTLAFPSYDGNGMYLSTGNVLVNPAVGMLFIDFERGPPDAARGHGHASTSTTRCATTTRRPSSSSGCRARAVYPNCPRYIHRYELVRRSRFVPAHRLPHPGARVEALRLGARRPARARPRPRPRRPRGPRTLTPGVSSPAGGPVRGSPGVGSAATRMPARGARFRPTFEPSESVRSENRAGKPYLATTARRTEATPSASRTTRAVPRKVGGPAPPGRAGRTPAARRCRCGRAAWSCPVSSTVMTANSPGSSSDGANHTGVATGAPVRRNVVSATYFAEASGWSAARPGAAPAFGSSMATA